MRHLFANDAKFVARSVARDWVALTFVVATMGLSAGATAAIFGVVDRVLLKGPSQIEKRAELVRLYHTEGPLRQRSTSSAFDYPAFDVLRSRATAFSGLGAYGFLPGTLGRGIGARRVIVGYVSGSLFNTLGTTGFRGRGLTESDDMPSHSTDAVVISWELWKAALGASDSALGASLTIDDRRYVVVGIAPRGFTGPEVTQTDVWLPIHVLGDRLGTGWQARWDSQWVTIAARVKHGTSRAVASAEATSLFRDSYSGADVETSQASISLRPLTYSGTGRWTDEASISVLLLVLSTIVMSIAAANLVSLMQARVNAREHELAVRTALGATIWDILRLFSIEALATSFCGGIVSLAIAVAVQSLIRTRLLPNVAWTDPSLTGQTAVVIITVGVIFAVALTIGPFLIARRIGHSALTRLGGTHVVPRSSVRQTAILAAQSAISVILISAAGFFLQSLWSAERIDHGVNEREVLIVSVQWPRQWEAARGAAGRREWERRKAYLVNAVARLRGLPQVTYAAIAMGSPFRSSAQVKIQPADLRSMGIRPAPKFFAVSGDYFAAIGTTIQEGRPIDARDVAGAERVVVLSRALATRIWPTGDALGRCVLIGEGDPSCTRVTGIASDVTDLHGLQRPVFYLPIDQTPVLDNVAIVARFNGRLGVGTTAIRTELLALDPAIEYIDVRPLADFVEPQLRSWRLASIMLGLMALLVLSIATVGIFGSTAHLVINRAREIAVRRAIGATSLAVYFFILRRSVGPSSAGILLGTAASVLGFRYVQPLLFSSSEALAPILVMAAGILFVVAVFAALAFGIPLNRRSIVSWLR